MGEQSKDDGDKLATSAQATVYEIRVDGLLDDHWQQSFEGMTFSVEQDCGEGKPCTVISGPVRDQPALHGVLSLIRDLNLTLISVRRATTDR